MAATRKICGHVLEVHQSFHQKHIQALLKKNKKLTCSETQCSHGLPHLWACLGANCTFIGCGRDQNKHLMAHYNLAKKRNMGEEHCVCINLRTKMVWCYACDEEVIDTDYGKDDAAFVEQLREALAIPVASPVPASRPATALSTSTHTRGACGLANLGNTCYANAAMQCLSNCPPLRTYFLRYMARQVKGRKKTSPLVFHFTQLIYDMWGGRYSSLRPGEVLREIRRFNPMFGGYAQQDSQEFMRCLLDRLHEDTKEELPRIESSPTSSGSADSGEKEKETKPPQGHDSDSNGVVESTPVAPATPPSPPPPPNYASIVSRIFQGYLLSRIKCLKCGKVSPTKDAFYDLSIPIPDDKMLDKVTKEIEAEGVLSNTKRPSPGLFSKVTNWLMLSNRTVTLEDCLQAFCTKEELMGADRYRCEHCKTLNDSQKFLRIAQPPELLCIHIKRFRHDSYFGGKLSDVVQFPLRDLDISRFCEQDADAPQVSMKYDLVSVVNHIGGISGGHYIAYALNDEDGKWYEFDDSWATAVSEDTVRNKEAYVLFYLRQSPEKEYERKQLLSAIAAFHEEEEREHAVVADGDCSDEVLENGSAADPMHIEKNGVVKRKKYFVCQEWLTRWQCTSSPGRINNAKYLCSHRRVKPEFSLTQAAINRNFGTVPEEVWTEFMNLYGGGPPVCESQFGECRECKVEEELLQARRREESKHINDIDRTFVVAGEMWYLISASWLQSWADFSKSRTMPPPGPIDNWCLLQPNGKPKPKLKCSIHYRGVVKEVWDFFHARYGGGPALLRPTIDLYAIPRSRSSSTTKSPSSSSSAARPIRSGSRPLSPITSPSSSSALSSSRSPSSSLSTSASGRLARSSSAASSPSPSASPSTSPSFPATMSASKRAAYYKNLNIQPAAQNGTSGDHERSGNGSGNGNGDAVEMEELTRAMKASEEKEAREKREHENGGKQHFYGRGEHQQHHSKGGVPNGDAVPRHKAVPVENAHGDRMAE